MTTTLLATSAEHLIAAIPYLAGFHPRNSLVCMTFCEGQHTSVIRYDLPAVGVQEETVNEVVGTVCRMTGVDAVVLVVYTDRAFPNRPSATERRLLASAGAWFAAAGFNVIERMIVAADGWGARGSGWSANARRSLNKIRTAAVSLDLVTRPEPAVSQRAWAAHPTPVDPILTGRVQFLLSALAAPRTKAGDRLVTRLGALADPLVMVERMLADTTINDPDQLAWMLFLLTHTESRESFLIHLGYGVKANLHSGTIEELLLGESLIMPDTARLFKGLKFCKSLLGIAPLAARPGLLCVLAWICWAVGRGSAAAEFAEFALAAEPGISHGIMVQKMVIQGDMPPWILASTMRDASIS